MLIQRNTKKKNTESFVKECILKNSKYDYSLGGLKNFKIQKERDSIKSNYCKCNNIKLLRISYKDDIKNKMKDVYY